MHGIDLSVKKASFEAEGRLGPNSISGLIHANLKNSIRGIKSTMAFRLIIYLIACFMDQIGLKQVFISVLQLEIFNKLMKFV